MVPAAGSVLCTYRTRGSVATRSERSSGDMRPRTALMVRWSLSPWPPSLSSHTSSRNWRDQSQSRSAKKPVLTRPSDSAP